METPHRPQHREISMLVTIKYICALLLPYVILFLVLFPERNGLFATPIEPELKFLVIFWETLLAIGFVALTIATIRWIKADIKLKRTKALMKEWREQAFKKQHVR